MIRQCYRGKFRYKKLDLHKTKSTKKIFYLGKSFPGKYLTLREKQCVAYFIQGYTNAEVADLLTLSRRTVEEYLNNIRKKLNCDSKRELVRKVLCSDLVKLLFS